MRSEPTTLGPLPQGAGNQCGGRDASFIFLGVIDSHLPSSVRPVPGKMRKKRARICLRARNRNSLLIILAFLVFDGLSAPSIPLISPQMHLKLHLGWTHSPGSAQLETRKQQAKACTLFHLEPSSFFFTARHLFSRSTPPPSWHLQRYCFKCCRNEKLLLRHHSVCNLSAARQQKPPRSNWCWYEGGATTLRWRSTAAKLQNKNQGKAVRLGRRSSISK